MRQVHHASGEYEIRDDGSAHARAAASHAHSPDAIAKGWSEIDSKDIPSLALAIRTALDEEGIRAMREANFAATRQALRESVTPDRHIIHASATIAEIDSVANRLSKRLRDWYALYYPELEREHRDHKAFVSAALEYPQRPASSMGGAFSDDDLATALSQAQLLSTLYAQREMLLEYIEKMMKAHAPNLEAIAGAMIGAQLVSLAGSMRRLAMMPAGTVQLLGAETALFRHLRNRRALPPKHGVIFNHKLIQQAPREKRGKAARALADCISIGARVDYFKGEFVGDTLLKKAEQSVKQ